MRPKEPHDRGQHDLLRSRLDQIIDTGHALAKLARMIDWAFLSQQFGAVYTDAPGQPPLPPRLMAGFAILKHMHDLSEESLCDCWLENPYYQYFCDEEFFRHKLPFYRSSITRWRQRMGEDRLVDLLQESLATATRCGAAKPAHFTRVIVDTTEQPKAIAFPTDAKLLAVARQHLVRMARQTGVKLRQSYARVGKIALIRHQRYAHAKQFKRANRALKTLRTQLGQTLRDIRRKISTDADLQAVFAHKLALAERVYAQRARQRGQKVFSLHAPEVECIGKGKACKPYEFGVKVSVATPIECCKGGKFIAHVAALPGNPYDGHTLAKVVPEITRQLDVSLQRIAADARYRGHNAPKGQGLSVFTSGAKRGVTDKTKRELHRCCVVEPVIGHLKSDHRMDRNHLKGRNGDAANAILAAIGYNFRLLLAWISLLWAILQIVISENSKLEFI